MREIFVITQGSVTTALFGNATLKSDSASLQDRLEAGVPCNFALFTLRDPYFAECSKAAISRAEWWGFSQVPLIFRGLQAG